MTSPKRLRNYIFVFFSLLILAARQTAAKSSAPVIIGSHGPGAFADDFFPKHMEDLHIPGLSVVFNQGGEVIYAKGYSYASLEHETPIDPAITILGIGSVSKPFIATEGNKITYTKTKSDADRPRGD